MKKFWSWVLSPLKRRALTYALKELEKGGYSVVRIKEAGGSAYIVNHDGSYQRIGKKEKAK